MDCGKTVNLYQMRMEERERKIRDFFNPEGSTSLLVIPRVGHKLFTACSTLEEILENNIEYLDRQLSIDLCDDVPFLEPWIGCGVYANAFGARYLWETGGAPDTVYCCNSLEEIRDFPYPDYRESPIMMMVLDAIDMLKDHTGGVIPISLTDTQSPQDTATLILNTVEFLTGMYTDPELVHEFLGKITKLKVEFSRVQSERIGMDLLASPGHGFVGYPFLSGIGVSDDNMVFSSPDLNEQFSFPYLNTLSREFGGLTLHSCGNWSKTMPRLKSLDNLQLIDFALPGNLTDTDPNRGAEVVAALGELDVILKVRPGHDLMQAMDDLLALKATGRKMIVEYPWSEESDAAYRLIQERLGR